MSLNFKIRLSFFLNYFSNKSFDLSSQNEELKGMLRANNLLLKDQEFKYAKMLESYELQLMRLGEENKQYKEKYEK
jgi:hypothetical protein